MVFVFIIPLRLPPDTPRTNLHFPRSVVSRFTQSTLWPTLLSCDAASGRKDGVKSRVVFMTYLALFMNILIGVAGVITPIGLGDGVRVGQVVNVTFTYAHDPSSFGQGTPSRADYVFSRVCGGLPCPGVHPLGDPFAGSLIPENITQCFESGSRGQENLYSGPFDIQFRQYTTSKTSEASNNLTGKTSPVSNITGRFSMIESILLLNQVDVREGVIIDAINGGIGLRNHTVPISPNKICGTEWTEELLWVEPVTSCFDTNWTVEYRFRDPIVGEILEGDFGDFRLLDRANGKTAFSHVIISNASCSENDPGLLQRAQTAATIFRYHLSTLIGPTGVTPVATSAGELYDIYSLSNSLQGNIMSAFASSLLHFPSLIFGALDDSTLNLNISNCFLSGPPYPEIISLDPKIFNLTAFNTTAYDNFMSSIIGQLDNNCSYNAIYKYDYTLPLGTWRLPASFENFTFSDIRKSYLYNHIIIKFLINNKRAIVNSCRGYSASDSPSFHKVFVDCGYLMTPPRAMGNFNDTTTTEQYYQQDIHVCASATRATVKKVTFQYNDTGGPPSLGGLQVAQILPKNYTSELEWPIWAVENPGPGWNLTAINLLWGIVNKTYQASEKVWTSSSEHLYLPAWSYYDPITESSSGGFVIGDSIVSLIDRPCSSPYINL